MQKASFVLIVLSMNLSIQYKDLPIIAIFYIFPLISIVAWSKGKSEINYDYVWISMLSALLIYYIYRRNFIFKKKLFHYLIIFLLLFAFKYLMPWLYYTNMSLKASLMDGKWVVYLALAILWIKTFGYPSIENLYKAGLFFSIIYIIKASYMIFTNQLSRSGVLMEANYDGFMILIVYCFKDQINNCKRWTHYIFILATFLTFSRTGILSMFVLWISRIIKKNVLLLIPIIPIMLGIAHLGISIRGAESAGHMDRFTYWEQAFVFFEQENWLDFMLGNPPGKSLEMLTLPEFEWTVHMFEEMRNLTGVFPFMFHSTYLRMAITWGIPVTIILTLFLVTRYIKSPYRPMKELCLLTLIQSFSLSSLTLPNVSLLLFMIFITALHQEKIVSKNL